MRLFLGTHRPTWLAQPGLPALMVSLNTMPKRAPWRAVVPWFVDSAGFTELQQHGRWRTTAEQHVERCSAIVDTVGMVEHLSPQDWMCEPMVIDGGTVRVAGRLQTFAGTGLSIDEHQHRTVENFLELTELAPGLPWVPVLQGWEEDDYHRCADLYESAGVNLADARLVGVGSVCRREATPDAVRIIRSIATSGYRLHGFGFKQDGIGACWPWLASADSMAWSYNARNEAHKARARGVPRPGGCTRDVSCANHQHYALDWYRRTVAQVAPIQLTIEGAA